MPPKDPPAEPGRGRGHGRGGDRGRGGSGDRGRGGSGDRGGRRGGSRGGSPARGSSPGRAPPRGGPGGPRGSPRGGPPRGVGPPQGPPPLPTGGAPAECRTLALASHVRAIGVKRPGHGTAGKVVEVFTNHFATTLDQGTIYHYNGTHFFLLQKDASDTGRSSPRSISV